jgi:hypothetical protein
MKKNIGNLDALIRIWTGSYIFGKGVSKKSLLMTSLGGLIMSEALTKSCLLYSMFGISTSGIENKPKTGKISGNLTGDISLD